MPAAPRTPAARCAIARGVPTTSTSRCTRSITSGDVPESLSASGMATSTSSHAASVLQIVAFSLAAMSDALGQRPRRDERRHAVRSRPGFDLLTVAATKTAMNGGVSSTPSSVSKTMHRRLAEEEQQGQLERQQDRRPAPAATGHAAATRTTSARGRAKETCSRRRQDGRCVRTSREQLPPIGHVAAARARNGEAGGEIRERNVRRQDGQHHRLARLEVERDHDDGVDRRQPQHGDDHAQPRQRVRHPRQRLRPGEQRRRQQRRPDHRHVDVGRPHARAASLPTTASPSPPCRRASAIPPARAVVTGSVNMRAGYIDWRAARSPARPKLNTARK